ncbi:aminoglycoside resistance protein [Mycobacterium sp. ITM-2017-0098]|nr:aminoglycoside resistance protein [Mycobacterium sp. ITM-2017-0098]
MTERHRDVHRAAQQHLDQWALRVDGPPRESAGSLVVPVLSSEGTAAVLKVSRGDESSEHEHLALRRWGGAAAVRLLGADPPARTILVERLHPQNLLSLNDTEACEIVAGLWHRLHVPPMPQLSSVTTYVAHWMDTIDQLPRRAAIPRRLVEQVAALSREVSADAPDEVLLHGNLHYGTVLGADREPWLAIAPRPMNGSPHYELAPMLWHRWNELADIHGGVRDGIRRRFFTLVDAAGLGEDLARAWTLIRVVHAWTRDLTAQQAPHATALTRYAAIAKAVQD